MNEYEKQASDFLLFTNTTLEIVEALPQKAPLWVKKGEKHGINYSVTLKNKRASYTFDYWNSIHNTEIIKAIENIKGHSFSNEMVQAGRILENEGINPKSIQYKKEAKEALKKKYEPSEYDILACLCPLYEDTLEDFCSAYGYEEDSITALKTFEACKEQDRMLRKLFNDSQLKLLVNIQ